MPIKFDPKYIISPKVMNDLLRIEAAKQKILHLPLTPTVLSSLRETARLYTTHYSTMIEGNRLDPEQVEEVLKHQGHFPGRERDEHEVKGYYAALTQVEKWTAQGVNITEKMIQTLHALVMANGKKRIKPTAYRDGQNVIRDSQTKKIVYMPPEAKDVKSLMESLANWINKNGIFLRKFEWADEYFAASVSENKLEIVRWYIRSQEEHHRKISFAEEYNSFLKTFGFSQG